MEDGKTLDGIFADLEGEGYTIESFIIPACGVGAWHRRDRIWIIAYSMHSTGSTNRGTKGKIQSVSGKHRKAGYSREFIGADNSFHSNNKCKRNERRRKEEIPELRGLQSSENGRVYANIEGRSDLSTPVLRRSYDGIYNGVDRIKGLSNAIVPQVAYELFKAIQKLEDDQIHS